MLSTGMKDRATPAVYQSVYLLNETDMGCLIPYWIAIIAGVATVLIVTMAILTHR